MEHDSYVLISVQFHEDVNGCVVISLSCQRTGTCLVLSFLGHSCSVRYSVFGKGDDPSAFENLYIFKYIL